MQAFARDRRLGGAVVGTILEILVKGVEESCWVGDGYRLAPK